MRRVASIIAGLCFGATALAADLELNLSQPLAAKLTEATCLHETPGIDAPTVMCLMEGAALTLVARMQNKATVDGKEGYWYKAQITGGAEGWVFSTFLDVTAGSGKCASCDKPCPDK